MSEPLDQQEIGVLLEALEAWESKDLSGEILGTLVESMMPAENRGLEYETKKQHAKDERERAKAMRKDQSVLLRAKLIKMRDSVFASEALR